MRGWLVGVFALLSAGAAQAESLGERFAMVGEWEIIANSPRQCGMMRLYPGTATDAEEVLIILYDAQRKAAVLTWGSRKPKLPPLGESLDLELALFGGSSKDQQWGTRLFRTEKRGDGYGFTHVFAASTDSDRFLRDLGAHDTFALFLGPTLMTGLPLNASDAVSKLRECSSRIVDQGTSDRL